MTIPTYGRKPFARPTTSFRVNQNCPDAYNPRSSTSKEDSFFALVVAVGASNIILKLWHSWKRPLNCHNCPLVARLEKKMINLIT